MTTGYAGCLASPRPTAARGGAGSRRGLPRIECQVEAEDVHAGLTQQAEQPALRVLRDEALHDGIVELARPGHATHLVEGRRRADMGVEPAARRGDEVHRHGRRVAGISGPEGVDTALHGLDQVGVRRAQVRGSRGARVVAERAGRRGTAPEILRVVEGLADERRAHGLSVLDDQAAVRLMRKDELSDDRHERWINDAGDDGEQDERDDRGADVSQHGVDSYTRWRATRIMSISLMPG